MTLVVLGRYGDILNCLPIAYAFHKRGRNLRWLVSHEYASILDGVSYVEPEIWQGSQDTLLRAINHVRNSGRPLIAQAWKNPDQRHKTDSFAKEQWRLAKMQEHYGKYPLVFDRRNPIREHKLSDEHLSGGGSRAENAPAEIRKMRTATNTSNVSMADSGSIAPPAQNSSKPIILVSTTSVSTPYKYADKLIATLRALDAEIIDLDNVRVSHVYDLLGLYERADCLVSVDTMHHHLSRASYLPVVYLRNDGWKGAVPVPQVRASWRYSEIEDLSQVAEATEKVISRSCRSLQVVVNSYPKGHSERHQRAMATHPKDTTYAVFEGRPRIKELLYKGFDLTKDGIVFTNDDVTFLPDTLDRIKNHLSKWDYGCSRRPRDPVHIGREIFFFRTDWLRSHWNEMPDPYWSVQKCDLILARWLRKLIGIPTTQENLNYDFAPVEIPAGLITHEEHPSHWTGETERSMEGQNNEKLWRESA